MKFYIDTSIWMDYYEDRRDNLRPIGEFAFQLLVFIKTGEHTIIVSDEVLSELGKFYSDDEIADILSIMKDEIEVVDITKEQHERAKVLALERAIPRGDAVHAIVAGDLNIVLVARDWHFEQVTDIVTTKKPEEII